MMTRATFLMLSHNKSFSPEITTIQVFKNRKFRITEVV